MVTSEDYYELLVYCYETLWGRSNSKVHPPFTQLRVDICSRIHKKMPEVFQDFHNSRHVEQINGVPENSFCAGCQQPVEQGIQLKFNNRHICLHTNELNIWYHYFRLRHFPEYICGLIHAWTQEQQWYQNQEEPTLGYITNSHWQRTIQHLWEESTQQLLNYLD